MRALLPAGLLLLTACGPAPAPSGPPLHLIVSAALIDQIGSYQVALVPASEAADCNALRALCLAEQLQPAQLLPFVDDQGRTLRALLVGDKALAERQSKLRLTQLPEGVASALYVEGLDKSSQRRLVGNGCTPLPALAKGQDLPVTVKVSPLPAARVCTPVFLEPEP